MVYPDEACVRALVPDLIALRKFAPYGFIATAEGDGSIDFVSRCFFPNHGIDEDPVTGSAHCVSGPYWAKKLKKEKLYARQVSERGGDLWLTILGDGKVYMAGTSVEVLEGTLMVPEAQ